MADYKFIKCWDADGIAWISINRPPLNIIDIPTAGELAAAVTAVRSREKGLSALVVTAEGQKAFSAGVDVADHTSDNAEAMLDGVHAIFRAMDLLALPTVAALKGLALGGGCEIALCCDLVVAADNLRIGLPEIKVGVFPPLAVAILHKLIPEKRAFELLMGGEMIQAEEARTLGLVNRVIPLDAFREELGVFLRNFSTLSRSVLHTAKRALRAARGRPFPEALPEVERIYLNELMGTKDAGEGLAAFIEKRTPIWTHN